MKAVLRFLKKEMMLTLSLLAAGAAMLITPPTARLLEDIDWHTLGTLLTNGVQMLQALGIVENTVGNVHIAAALRDTRDRIADGSSLSRPLAQTGLFPKMLTDMLAVGEESGDMATALDHIGKRYDGDLDRAIKVFTTLLEPIMMLGIAIGVGFVAIAMLSAVFEMTSGLQH